MPVRVEHPGFDAEEFDIEIRRPVERDRRCPASRHPTADSRARSPDAVGAPARRCDGDTIRSGTLEQKSITPTTRQRRAFQIENLPTPNTYVLTFTKRLLNGDALGLAGGEELRNLHGLLVDAPRGTWLGTIAAATTVPPLGGVAVSHPRSGQGHHDLADRRRRRHRRRLVSPGRPPGPGVYTVTYTLAATRPRRRPSRSSPPASSRPST